MNYLWLVLALLSAISAALVAIFGKIGLQNLDTNTATAIRAIVMAIFLFGVVVFEGKLHNIQPILANHRALLFIILSGVAGAVSWLFYFWALKLGKVQQIVPIDRMSMVFAVILAVIFLGEKLSLKVIIGTLAMLFGAIIISLA